MQKFDLCFGGRIASLVVSSFLTILSCIFFIPSVAHAVEDEICLRGCETDYQQRLALCACELHLCEQQEQNTCEEEQENQPGFFEYWFWNFWSKESSELPDTICRSTYTNCKALAETYRRDCRQECHDSLIRWHIRMIEKHWPLYRDHD